MTRHTTWRHKLYQSSLCKRGWYLQTGETPDDPEHEEHIKDQAYTGKVDVIGSWNDQNAARCLDILENILGIWVKIKILK